MVLEAGLEDMGAVNLVRDGLVACQHQLAPFPQHRVPLPGAFLEPLGGMGLVQQDKAQVGQSAQVQPDF